MRTFAAVMTAGPVAGAPLLLLKRANETELTYRLKWAAWTWLHETAGCREIGFEVRLEGPGGRITDVVGLGPGNTVYVVEVKVSRSDAARDDNTPRDPERLLEKTRSVEEAVSLTAGVLGAAATLARTRMGDDWRQDAAYRAAAKEHRRAVSRQQTLGVRLSTFSTKFHDPAYLRCGDCHYIMAPAGLVRPSEVPPFWGLLDPTPSLVVEAPVKQVRRVTPHVLRAIARANTRDLMVARQRAEL